MIADHLFPPQPSDHDAWHERAQSRPFEYPTRFHASSPEHMHVVAVCRQYSMSNCDMPHRICLLHNGRLTISAETGSRSRVLVVRSLPPRCN